MTVKQKTKLDWVAILKRMTWPAVILLIVVVLIVFGILVPITEQTQIIELLKVVTWPAVVVFIIFVFHETIKERVRKTTDFKFEMPGGLKIALTVSELEAILKTMLQEVDSIVEHMTPEQSVI